MSGNWTGLFEYDVINLIYTNAFFLYNIPYKKRKENDQFFTKQGQEAGLKLYGEKNKAKGWDARLVFEVNFQHTKKFYWIIITGEKVFTLFIMFS